jgi:hypothetical protein
MSSRHRWVVSSRYRSSAGSIIATGGSRRERDFRHHRGRPNGTVTRTIRNRPKLEGWLEAATKLGAIVRTAPNQADNVADFHAACAILAAPKQ